MRGSAPASSGVKTRSAIIGRVSAEDRLNCYTRVSYKKTERNKLLFRSAQEKNEETIHRSTQQSTCVRFLVLFNLVSAQGNVPHPIDLMEDGLRTIHAQRRQHLFAFYPRCFTIVRVLCVITQDGNTRSQAIIMTVGSGHVIRFGLDLVDKDM